MGLKIKSRDISSPVSKVSLGLVRLAGRPRFRCRLAQGIERIGQGDGIQSVIIAVFDDRRIDIKHHRHFALLAGRHGLLGETEAVDLLEIRPDRQRRHIVGSLPGRGPRRLVGHGEEYGDDLTDPDLDFGLFRLELPRQAARDIGIETHRDLACQRRSRRRRGRHLRGAVEAGGAAEPVIERHRGIGCTDHQYHHETADRRHGGITTETAARYGLAAQYRLAARGRLLACGRLLLICRLVFHLVHIGRTSTAGPLTRVTAKNSTTRTPSASAMAIERCRRLFFCASVRTIPFGGCLLSMPLPRAPYQIDGARARTTTSISKVANSANKYTMEKANSLRVARSASLPWRRR